VFIHGGFADWTFWSNQIAAFAPTYRVIAVDLAGHGESGKGRARWTVSAFAGNVLAVIAKENVKRAVVIGNSLGGPVAMEVASALGSRVIGVVAVDTLHDMTVKPPPGYYEKLAAAYRSDYQGTLRRMVDTLFHKDTDPDLRAPLEKTMLANGTASGAISLMESFASYKYPTITQPIRCINGDLYPTQVENNRKVHADFEAVIMTHAGHYPMLERPAEFNQHLRAIVTSLVTAGTER
jgi:pimeloyl-ACP methyl ester carboxylesterase